MIFLTMAARVQDGLLLVASTDAAHEMSEQMDVYKSQAKQLLRKLNARSPAKQIIESGPCSFFYLLDQNICYLTLADKGYPRKLLFSYLEEIKDGFIQELSRDFGPEWKRQVETAARPYAFIKFDKFIQSKRRDYLDPTSRRNTSKLTEDLADISSIMKKNIQEVLNRGERLDNISQTSSRLVNDSKKYKWGAKKLSMMALYQQYAPFLVLGGIALVVIYLKFFW